MIKLDGIVYDVRARDGTWCTLPYPGHPKGCPQFPKCIANHPNFKDVKDVFGWWAVIEEFDLQSYALERKIAHPEYSERQCRNLLYWQGGVKKRLRQRAYTCEGLILAVPEACGVHVFETMERVGIVLERYPQIVRKIMLVGKK